MALTVVESPLEKDERLPPPNPPDVAITPCGDMWPKPYFFQDGLRRVEPYHFTYKTNVKERWRGREILDIFASEFRDRPMDYYVRLQQ
jgi:tRNA pseudouridine synthase 9